MASKKHVFHFDIEGEMTIFRAEELKEAILPLIANNDEIEIDLSKVTEIDGAGLQLMISVKLEAWQHQKELHFIGHSAPVTSAIDICGLSNFFGDPIVISSQAA
jgi:anti-anti-sigma factor